MFSNTTLAFAGSALLYVLWRSQAQPRRKLPPGPKPLPVIGNLLQLPTHHEWLTYAEWAKTYGDVIHVNVLGQSIVVLDTLAAATELLEKKSSIYSDRPRLVMAGELVAFAEAGALMRYGERFKALRRLMHRELTAASLEKYWPLHEEESRILVRNAMRNPRELLDLVRHYSGSVILKVTYGYQTAPKQDQWLVLAEQVMGVFSQAATPGAWLVDLLPALKDLPDWVPGTGFKKIAAEWRKLHMRVIEGPYDWAKEHQDKPDLVKPNFTTTILEQGEGELSPDDDNLLMWASASLFGGGADTTVSSISTFYLAMALFPDVQKRGQEEVDRVTGGTRLPEIRDRPSMPYVEGIVRETLRWHPVTPMALPHRLTQDDEYRGYHLPAGTLVMPNIWSIMRDEKVFPNPNSFDPARFIGNDAAVKVAGASFGFGRRACPGREFAESSMFIAVATALATCHVVDAVDEKGAPVPRDVGVKTGTISHPELFSCSITPRSAVSAALLEASLAKFA